MPESTNPFVASISLLLAASRCTFGQTPVSASRQQYPPNRSGFNRRGLSMPSPPLTSRELVDRLDARHDELIARLDELNAQIEASLAEFGWARETAEATAGREKPRRAA
jgi:hypothetical protein